MAEKTNVTEKQTRPAGDSVERALAQVGDRWTFLILREAFFGVKRFDEIQANTKASPAVLADRIKKLVAHGIFGKSTYSAHPNRFEYHLTEKGRDLYPIIVLLMQWGDTWAGTGESPLALHHSCGAGHPFTLACADCGEPVTSETTVWSTASDF